MASQRRYPRTARVNEAVLEVLAEELERMNDPRLELVTLTGVDVSRDLSHAYDYVQIAEVCLQDGRHDQALGWAERGAAAFPERTDPRLRQLLGDE